MEFLIRDIKIEDRERIAKIWIKSLPTDFIAMLGESFIKNVYIKEFFLCQIPICKVATLNGYVVAFLFAAKSDGLLSRLIIKHPLFFFGSWFASILKDPFRRIVLSYSVLHYLIKSFLVSRQIQNHIELCYIAVSDTYRDLGIGSKLINNMINEIRNKKNINTIYVKTLKSGVLGSASKFYESNAFDFESEVAGRLIYKINVLGVH